MATVRLATMRCSGEYRNRTWIVANLEKIWYSQIEMKSSSWCGTNECGAGRRKLRAKVPKFVRSVMCLARALMLVRKLL
jgi:hypothetical protein